MSDWLEEYFEQADATALEGEVSWTQKTWLLGMLTGCRYDDNVHEQFEVEILSSDLTRLRFEELVSTFEMNALDVRYDYAPRQKDLSRFIRMICGLNNDA